jgi:uncharacterized double-CXXCG motif protein
MRPGGNMRFYSLEEVSSPRHAWDLRTEQKWLLPGVRCPRCGEVFAGIGEAYPAVELSALPEQGKLKARVEEDFAEFTRLRERVRPLVPAGATLEPGTRFGPLSGTARGDFPGVILPNAWTVLVRKETLEQLQAGGLRGLNGCRMELRFRGKNPPELLELQVEPRGLLHPDCLPRGMAAPCETCGRYGFGLPAAPILDSTSLPTDRDLFRLANFKTVIVGTERFAETVRRLGIEEVEFRELPVR